MALDSWLDDRSVAVGDVVQASFTGIDPARAEVVAGVGLIPVLDPSPDGVFLVDLPTLQVHQYSLGATVTGSHEYWLQLDAGSQVTDDDPLCVIVNADNGKCRLLHRL